MSLPEKGDWLEEVTYVELEETEAKEIVKKYNTAGKEAGYGGEKRFGRRDDRWYGRRKYLKIKSKFCIIRLKALKNFLRKNANIFSVGNEYRGKNFRERSYHNQRYDPRSPRQGGWSNQRSGGGNWNRDRRNNRGPPTHEWRGMCILLIYCIYL